MSPGLPGVDSAVAEFENLSLHGVIVILSLLFKTEVLQIEFLAKCFLLSITTSEILIYGFVIG